MAAGFEYFDSTMVGAPPLRYGAGYWAAFLDYWLVTKGGWAIEFTGTNLRAYRSATGNRFRLRLDDTQALYARLRAYRSMSGISSGLSNPFPTASQATLNTTGVRKAYDSAGTSPHGYWGIRTNKYIAVFFDQTEVATAGLIYRGFFAFGDVPSLCEADSHNTVIQMHAGVDTTYYESLNSTSAIPMSVTTAPAGGARTTGMSGTPNGSVASPYTTLHRPWDGGASAAQASAVALTGRLNFGPMVIGGTDSASAPTATFPRAVLPNVHMVYGAASLTADANYPCQDLVPFSIGARDFLPLLITGQAQDTCFLLETTDTDGAL